MKARPSFQFYPSDWLRDPGLRSCSLAARGLWIDMLAFMHEAEPYGHLRLNGQDIATDSLARMVGTSPKETQRHLDELERCGVFSRTPAGTIYSRRMVRDQDVREKRADGGRLSLNNPAVPRKKDRSKDGQKDTLHPSLPASLGGSPSSSSSSSSSKKKDRRVEAAGTAPPNGTDRFADFWDAYPARNGKKIEKSEAQRRFLALSEADQAKCVQACRHYAASQRVKDGIGIKDPKRFLRDGRGSEYWREWLEPERAGANGHGGTCTKRVQQPGDTFSRPCGQSAVAESRPDEPRCAEHFRAGNANQEKHGNGHRPEATA